VRWFTLCSVMAWTISLTFQPIKLIAAQLAALSVMFIVGTRPIMGPAHEFRRALREGVNDVSRMLLRARTAVADRCSWNRVLSGVRSLRSGEAKAIPPGDIH